jgi:hypothetical protein
MTTLVDFQSARRNQQYEVESLLGALDERQGRRRATRRPA